MSHGIKTKIGLFKATKAKKGFHLKPLGLEAQRGFTLIELMITVAIVGILAAVALPAYQDYTIRAQVSEAFTLLDGLKPQMEEAYANNGAFPQSLSDLGIHTIPLGKYGYATVGAGGEVEVVFGNAPINPGNQANSKINLKNLSFLPVVDANGNIHWSCGGGDTNMPKMYIPSSCVNS